MAGHGSSDAATGQIINVQLERSVALQLLQALSIATGVPCAKAKGSKGSGGKAAGKAEGKSTGKAAGKSTGKAEGKAEVSTGKSAGKAAAGKAG